MVNGFLFLGFFYILVKGINPKWLGLKFMAVRVRTTGVACSRILNDKYNLRLFELNIHYTKCVCKCYVTCISTFMYEVCELTHLFGILV